jgi:Xaa-Pro aminopeptidase
MMTSHKDAYNYKKRIHNIQQKLKEKSFNAFMICNAENRFYLTGFFVDDDQIDEISGLLFITEKKVLLATDSRYYVQAQSETTDIEIFCYNDKLEKVIPAILKKLSVQSLGFESTRIPVSLYEKLQRSIIDQHLLVRLIPVPTFVEDDRTTKEDNEIKMIQRALDIAESSFLKVVNTLKPTMTEKEIAWNLESEIRQSGADSLAFSIIVASGPNAALPHAIPTDRVIGANTPVLFDWGARINGYRSDISRTIVLGEPESEFIQAFNVLAETQQMAINEISEGKKAKDIAKKAHDYLEKKGYAEVKFAHGLGHGVGLATHESPHLSLIKDTVLKKNSVVTVEPGIYIPNRWGIRLENMVVVKDGPAHNLNALPIQYQF